MKSYNRRVFLKYAALLNASLASGGLIPRYPASWRNPKLLSRRSSKHVEVNLSIGQAEIPIDGRHAKPLTINGTLPGPLLRFTEGDEVLINVTNHLAETTSLHWHGILLPEDMDGVPNLSFDGIAPGETFQYRYRLTQSGTYWYHGHSGLQEQRGLYGPLIIDPATPVLNEWDSEFVVLLSDWTFENPDNVYRKLKKSPGYYNYQKQTLLGKGGRDRAMWSRMRMDPTDIADVTGATYSYLINGRSWADPFYGLFERGETVRLRFINGASATYFDVRIPGLKMTIIQVDGQDVVPFDVDEFRIALAETVDVLVEPTEDAYTVFAESMDRSGFVNATLASRKGLVPPIPELRARTLRTMADMGMDHGDMSHDEPNMSGQHSGHAPSEQQDMTSEVRDVGTLPVTVKHSRGNHGKGNAGIPDQTTSRLTEPGLGLENSGRVVMLYSDLEARIPNHSLQRPSKEIEIHLTGNMDRYMWSFDGNGYSDRTEPIRLKYGEMYRLIFVNDTMMEHPIHLHGMWMYLENGKGHAIPRKHTVNVKPAERLSVIVEADAPGRWAMHCHILYHMKAGMFRVFHVEGQPTANERGHNDH